jgi:hypothetical protein
MVPRRLSRRSATIAAERARTDDGTTKGKQVPAIVAASDDRHVRPMLNIVSILIGLVALVLAIPALVPIISLMNWVVFPIALVGFVVGLLSSKTSGRNLNLVILIVSGLRLFLTGGLI